MSDKQQIEYPNKCIQWIIFMEESKIDEKHNEYPNDLFFFLDEKVICSTFRKSVWTSSYKT